MTVTERSHLRELERLLRLPCLFSDDAARVEILADRLGVRLAWRRYDMIDLEARWSEWSGDRQLTLDEYLPPPADDDQWVAARSGRKRTLGEFLRGDSLKRTLFTTTKITESH